MARLASGGKHGLAQSLFQVGGNAGSACGPLLAALIVIPLGQGSLVWFSPVALFAMLVLWQIGHWKAHQQKKNAGQPSSMTPPLSKARTMYAMAVLIALVFTKYIYTSSFHSYYTFYLIERFSLGAQAAQMLLFVFLSGVALGTILGGPMGDRIGRKRVIWFSILGRPPFRWHCPMSA